MWCERASYTIFESKMAGLLYLKEDLEDLANDWYA
jgi:hypothetical protein